MPSFATRSLVYVSILLFVLVIGVKCDFEILVLHTNDMHSRFDETDVKGDPIQNTGEPVFGGFARLKKAVDEARAEAESQNISSVFLNAGDTFQGTAFYTMLKDQVVSSLIPLIGIEAMSLGNHEFDDGVAVLAKFLRNISIPVVACNLNFTREKDLQLAILTPSTVLQKKDKKIGVIGYLLPETKITRVNRAIIDTEKPPSIEKADGLYPVIELQANGKRVPVVQAYAFTKYLGKLWVTFDDKGDFVSARPESNPKLLNSTVPEDHRAHDTRPNKCTFGRLEKRLQDARMQFGQSHHRRLRRRGNFTYEEILTMLPYKTPLYKVGVVGSDLREALELSVSKHNVPNNGKLTGEFLHVAGIRVVYDFSKPIGRRISDAFVRCANCSVPRYAALNDITTYTIVMSQYLRDGGDGYLMFKNGFSEPIVDNEYPLSDTDAVANYFKKSRVNYPGIDRRIVFANDRL
ncbi:5'-nucleotidase [Sarracenia purpurea var. burkii]